MCNCCHYYHDYYSWLFKSYLLFQKLLHKIMYLSYCSCKWLHNMKLLFWVTKIISVLWITVVFHGSQKFEKGVSNNFTKYKNKINIKCTISWIEGLCYERKIEVDLLLWKRIKSRDKKIREVWVIQTS
jgi:hypothetical protein